MTYDFYVKDAGEWYGVIDNGKTYTVITMAVSADGVSRWMTQYPKDNDPENWMNIATRYSNREEA